MLNVPGVQYRMQTFDLLKPVDKKVQCRDRDDYLASVAIVYWNDGSDGQEKLSDFIYRLSERGIHLEHLVEDAICEFAPALVRKRDQAYLANRTLWEYCAKMYPEELEKSVTARWNGTRTTSVLNGDVTVFVMNPRQIEGFEKRFCR